MNKAEVDNPELMQLFKMSTEMHLKNAAASLVFIAFPLIITQYLFC